MTIIIINILTFYFVKIPFSLSLQCGFLGHKYIALNNIIPSRGVRGVREG